MSFKIVLITCLKFETYQAVFGGGGVGKDGGRGWGRVVGELEEGLGGHWLSILQEPCLNKASNLPQNPERNRPFFPKQESEKSPCP